MPMFTLSRNYTLRSMSGATITFKKDAATFVPPSCVAEAVHVGAVRADGPQEALVEDELAPVKTISAEEKAEKLAEAIKIMLARNQRGDFTGNGSPNAKVLSSMVDFQVDNTMRDTAWQKFLDAQNEEK